MAAAYVLISKVLGLLASFTVGEIEEHVKQVVGVKEDLQMLTHTLRSIQAVLVDAERRQLQEETVRLWLDRLMDISYEIDDVLDEWNTEIMKSKGTLKPKWTKLWYFLLSLCSCFHEVGFRHDIAVRIRKLNADLDDIAKEKDRYSFQLIKGNEHVQRVMTTSAVSVPDVQGRERDLDAVINLLLAERKPHPHVISVVGMGGIGKTTLAKLVYNQERVKFDERIWICVSDPFDEIRIAKAMLESLKKEAPNLVEMQNISEQIQQRVLGKRVLLVLDDVWNEDRRRWEQVEDLLKCSSQGSKILVTTRNANVARIMGRSDNDIIRPELLSPEDCWTIFTKVVFSEGSSETCVPGLEEIGRKIVDKCKGLPLAVKTIGGHLSFKNSIEEWQNVLNSELWDMEDVKSGVLAPLRLSYDDLSSHLKQCICYCVIFPKDCRISKRELIKMWMSQGYIRETKNKDLEIIGEECFQNLTMRSFFQDFEEDYYIHGNTLFKMHDIVYDFCQSITKGECYNIEIENLEESKIDSNINNIRHMGIVATEKVQFPSSFHMLRRLRSLIFLGDGYSMIEMDLPNICQHITCLRSLSLKRAEIGEVPSSIDKLVHLRWLDLSDTDISTLPKQICELYNLQILNVERCGLLVSVPREIERLCNLRCLYTSECDNLLLPKEIATLSRLQRLGQINVDLNEKEALSLGDLKKLNNLRGDLTINWSGQRTHLDEDEVVRDAQEALLKEKKQLTHLQLFLVSITSEELFEALEPSPNLRWLCLRGYLGTKISWITSLDFLKSLILSLWKNCEELPPLGKLPSLESLSINSFLSIKKVGVEFLGTDNVVGSAIAFPKLMELTFFALENWKEWTEDEEGGTVKTQAMPRLHYLKLRNCSSLEALPRYILQNTSLKLEVSSCDKLQIIDVPISSGD